MTNDPSTELPPIEAAKEGRYDPHKWAREFGVDIGVAVSELPDRTSPDDWPEAMLVTASELSEIVENRILQELETAFESGKDEGEAVALQQLAALKAEVERLTGNETWLDQALSNRGWGCKDCFASGPKYAAIVALDNMKARAEAAEAEVKRLRRHYDLRGRIIEAHIQATVRAKIGWNEAIEAAAKVIRQAVKANEGPTADQRIFRQVLESLAVRVEALASPGADVGKGS